MKEIIIIINNKSNCFCSRQTDKLRLKYIYEVKIVKKILIKMVLGLAVAAFLMVTITVHCKIALKNAYS